MKTEDNRMYVAYMLRVHKLSRIFELFSKNSLQNLLLLCTVALPLTDFLSKFRIWFTYFILINARIPKITHKMANSLNRFLTALISKNQLGSLLKN